MTYGGTTKKAGNFAKNDIGSNVVVTTGDGWVDIVSVSNFTVSEDAESIKITSVSHSTSSAPDSSLSPADQFETRIIRDPGAAIVDTSGVIDMNNLLSAAAASGLVQFDTPDPGVYTYKLQTRITKVSGSTNATITYDRATLQIDERVS